MLTAHSTSPISKIKLFNRYGGNKKIAIWGCSGNFEVNEIDDELQKILINSAYLSVRSKDALRSLKQITKRKDIDLIPDLAFALDAKKEKSSIKKTVGVNLFPPLMNVLGKTIVQNKEPSEWYKKHMPELADRYLKIPIDYIDATKNIIKNLKKQGYKIVNVAFTLEDYLVAKTIYKDYVDEFLPFKQDPVFLINKIVDFDFFIATRFHANVFSLIANTPLYSLAYAPKCEMLFDDLNLDASKQFSTINWVDDKKNLIECFSELGGVTMSRDVLDTIRCRLKKSAKSLLSSL
ncbi:polysaccharide pyruvyl transferase family protein [Endozoicomonas sp. SESOKO1]|uniref:polysaccharide pyruvyl transferase family protein n=1 Tax=Endozoicomonas sp. SESOKO1 TaxID=2828742 RepID=UPI00214838F0